MQPVRLNAMARTPRPQHNAPTGSGSGSWALGGAVLGGLVALVVFAPAVWLERAAFAATDGRVVLLDSQGTVWSGSATLGLTGGPGSTDAARLPGRVQWDVRPHWNGLRLALRADCCTPAAQQLSVQAGLRSWRLHILPGQSTWPAAVLAGLGTPWNTVQLQGALQFTTPGMTLVSAVDRISLEGSAQLDMPDMASRLSTLRPLGSYQLSVQGAEQPTLELRTLKGSLQLQGSGQWTAGHLRFGGEARADAAHEAELSNLLNIMGRRDGARSVITLG
jgi:general secretion pathway protein N